MDKNQIITQGRARFEHHAAKKLLKEKYEAKMVFGYNGGLFRAGPELLMTIEVCPDNKSVIVDEYGNPVEINTTELKQLAQQIWQEQMNMWLTEFNSIRKNR